MRLLKTETFQIKIRHTVRCAVGQRDEHEVAEPVVFTPPSVASHDDAIVSPHVKYVIFHFTFSFK